MLLFPQSSKKLLGLLGCLLHNTTNSPSPRTLNNSSVSQEASSDRVIGRTQFNLILESVIRKSRMRFPVLSMTGFVILGT